MQIHPQFQGKILGEIASPNNTNDAFPGSAMTFKLMDMAQSYPKLKFQLEYPTYALLNQRTYQNIAIYAHNPEREASRDLDSFTRIASTNSQYKDMDKYNLIVRVDRRHQKGPGKRLEAQKIKVEAELLEFLKIRFPDGIFHYFKD